jgi:hypothetical protein
VQTGSLESAQNQTITTAAVEISPGASLRFQGTVAGNISVGGTVAAGREGTGALQVNGDVVFQSGGVFAVNLGGTGKGITYGSITVTGGATLGGALDLDCVNGFEDLIVKGNSFTILTSTNLIGTFDGVANGARVSLPDELGTLKVTYTDTSVVLSDWEPVFIDQTWDPGDTDEGTFVYTNARPRGHRHFFRIHAQETDIGAWRSRLTPVNGEADLYIAKGPLLPSKTSNFKRSENVGADGFVLNATQFAGGEEWFAMVYADPGTPWKFLTGRAYVQGPGNAAMDGHQYEWDLRYWRAGYSFHDR